MSVLEHLIEILTDEFEIPRESIRPDAELAELGLNSLMAFELVFAIEDRLGIDIPADEVSFETLGEAAEVIERLVAAKEG